MTGDSRARAERLDAADPLAGFLDRFTPVEDGLIYLDGNSLGRLPASTASRLAQTVEQEWGRDLIGSWQHWIDLPVQVGDRIGSHLLGAAPGQVAVADSTSVNFYRLAVAALDARPGRPVIVTEADNFPTDLYVLQGLAAQRGAELRLVPSDPVEGPSLAGLAAAVDERTALVTLSHVAYGSGALLDLAAVSALARQRGALALWDLSHAAGSVPVDLDEGGADLAVGCGYKYLNGGPGAPAFLYVRRELQAELTQPVWGWFGQREQFAMAAGYDPQPDIRRFLVGTPPVLGLQALDEGVGLLAEAGIDRLRDKGMALTSYFVELSDAWLSPLGFGLASPRDPARRGSHVSLRHDDAWRICRALIERARVVPDFRGPDRIRFGPAPLSTSFTDVWDALDRLRRLVHSGEQNSYDRQLARVT